MVALDGEREIMVRVPVQTPLRLFVQHVEGQNIEILARQLKVTGSQTSVTVAELNFCAAV